MKQVTLKNPSKMGDRDPKYGQAYWSHNHDLDAPVMFNWTGEGDLHDGQVVTAETVELATSKSGNDYYKLKKVRLGGTQQTVTGSTANPPKKEWQPRDDDRIVAQWAIGQAVTWINGPKINIKSTGTLEAEIEAYAKIFYAMVDRVKGGGRNDQQPTDIKTGYDQFKKTGESLPKSEEESSDVVADYGGEEIDLSQIPF